MREDCITCDALLLYFLVIISQTFFSYGLCIRNMNMFDGVDQFEIEIKFSPDSPRQSNLLVRCQRDHPFFVKDKGMNSL